MSRKLIQSNQTAFHIYEKYVISDRTKVMQEHTISYCMQLNIPWWRSHPIHENRATQSIWTEPCNPLLRATKSTKRATSIYEMTLIFYYLIFE